MDQNSEKKFKTLKCKKCKKMVENVGERASAVTCSDCVQEELQDAYCAQNEETIDNSMKGGKNMAKKEKQEKVEVVEKTEKTEGKSAVRQENATALIKYLNEELKLDDSEKRKTMSRAYGIIAKGQK